MDEDQHLIASGNVQLISEKISLNANQVIINTKKNYFSAKGNVLTKYNDQILAAEQMTYDINKEKLKFNDLSTTLNIEEAATPIHFKSKNLESAENQYWGKKGDFTTCHFSDSHYQIHADSFILYPKEKIAATNVYSHSGLIPLFWTPYYEFRLGHQNPIWLYPIFGNNHIEGGFIKNTFDYYHNKDIQSLILIDHMEYKGYGLGANTSLFKNGPWNSKIYWYTVTSIDYIVDLKQNIKFDPDNDLSLHWNHRNMYLLNGGRENYLNKDLKYENKDLGSIKVKLKDDYRNSQEQKTYEWNKKFTKGPSIYIKFHESTNSRSKHKLKSYNFNYNDTSISNQFSYSKNEYHNFGYRENQNINNRYNMRFNPLYNLQLNTRYTTNLKDNEEEESELYPTLILTYYTNRDKKTPLKFIDTITTKIDLKIDSDGNRVTKDNNSNLMETLTEINTKMKRWSDNGSYYQGNIIYGKYRERRDVTIIRDITKQRLLLKNFLNWRAHKSWLAQFDIGANYDQYLYETGDKQYKSDQTNTLTLFPENSLHNKTTYKEGNSDGYTPFYFDVINHKQKRMDNTLTYLMLKGLTLVVNDGRDLINNKRDPQKYSLNYRLDKKNYCNLSSAYDHEKNSWYNLAGTMELKKDKDNYLSYRASYSLKKGEFDSSSLKNSFTIGDLNSSDGRWIFYSEIVWEKIKEKYDIPYVKITKEFDCLKLSYEWNSRRSEYIVMFTINAFPNEAIGYSEGLEGTKIKGIETQSYAR